MSWSLTDSAQLTVISPHCHQESDRDVRPELRRLVGTAQFGSEWYPRSMYNVSDPAYGHHLATYGDPFADWQKDILNAMGTFLKQNGTAIYNTRAWNVYGEGPTKMGGGSFTAPTAGIARDIRYTASKDGDALYAILLGWPGNGRQITLANVTAANFDVGEGQVYLFAPIGGSAISLAFTQYGSGLHVALPETRCAGGRT